LSFNQRKAALAGKLLMKPKNHLINVLAIAAVGISIAVLGFVGLLAFEDYVRIAPSRSVLGGQISPKEPRETPTQSDNKGEILSNADALALTQSFLSLFALFLAFIGLVATLALWWLQKKLEELNGQSSSLSVLVDAQNDNVISFIDFVWSRTPQITFTQQISFQVVWSLAPIQQFFVTHESENFWSSDYRKRSRGRIYFILAMHKFASDPTDMTYASRGPRQIDRTSQKTAIDLLLIARSDQHADRRLYRSASLRLSQAFRQCEMFEEARTVLKNLDTASRQKSDALGRNLGQWGGAMVDLQEGLASPSESNRASHFAAASKTMSNVYRSMFGDNRGLADFNESDLPNIAYYSAKAMWAARLTQASDDPSIAAGEKLLGEAINRIGT
jgi:hypothetical protein